MRGLEHAFEQRVVDRVGTEAAHVAAPVDDGGERGAGGVVEPPAARVGGAVGRARGVELGPEQRSPHAMRPRAATVRRWMRAPDSTAPCTACAMAAPIAVAGPAKATSRAGRRRDADRVGGRPRRRAVVVERAHARVGQRLGLGLRRRLHGGDERRVAQRLADDHEDVDGPDARQRARAPARRGQRLADADGGHGARRAPVAAHAGAHVGGREHPDHLARVQRVGPRDLGQVRLGVGARVVVGHLEVEPVAGAGQAAAEHRARQAAVRGGQRGQERIVGPFEPHGAASSK